MKLARIAIKSGFVIPAIAGPLAIVDLFTAFPFAGYWYLDLALLFASIVIPYLAWDAWHDCIGEPLYVPVKRNQRLMLSSGSARVHRHRRTRSMA